MIRRWLLAGIAVALLLGACAQATSRAPGHVWTTPAHVYKACVSADCGGYPVTLNWAIPAISGQTGFYLFVNGSQQDAATASPFVFYGLDCGTTFTLGVESHDGSGDVGPLYTAGYTTPACPGAPGTGNFDDEFTGSSVNTAPNGWTVFDNTFGNSPNAHQCDFATQVTEGGNALTETMAAGSFSCTANGGGSANSEGGEVQTRDFAIK